MGDPTSSYATSGIALKISGAFKPYHHDKVENKVGNNNIQRLKTVLHGGFKFKLDQVR
jgi:hypothetical protein